MSEQITEYYLIPCNQRDEIMSYEEFKAEFRKRECSNVAARTDDETIQNEYRWFVNDCKKYNCTDIRMGRYNTTKETMKQDFEEKILPQYPNAIKEFGFYG